MADELVTIATYSDPMFAHIAQARLEAEGIESYLINENLAGMHWLYSSALGGVKLQVRRVDVAQAGAIMEEIQSKQEVKTAQARSVELTCPECESSNVVAEAEWSGWAVIIWIALTGVFVVAIVMHRTWIVSVPLLLWFMLGWFLQRKNWRCGDCGFEWTGRKRRFPT